MTPRWNVLAALSLCTATAAAQPEPEPPPQPVEQGDEGGAEPAPPVEPVEPAAPVEPEPVVPNVDRPTEPWPAPDAAPAPRAAAKEKTRSEVEIAGYDKGFFLRSPDDAFELKVNGRVKFRFTYLTREDDEQEDEFAFAVRTVRLSFSGHAFTDDFTFKIQPAWEEGNVLLKDAYFDYRFIDGVLQLRAGQIKKPYSRERIMSDGDLAFAERSILEKAQKAGRDIGFAIHNGYEKAPMVDYAVGLFNGSGDAAHLEGDVFSNVPDRFGPLLAWRLGVSLGELKAYDQIDFEGKGVRCAVALDGQARFNAGGNNDAFVYPGADYLFKAYGFTSYGRMFLAWDQAEGGKFKDQEYSGIGFHLEANYLIAKRVAPMFRYARVMPENDPVKQEILGGAGAYVFEHKLQAQVEGGAVILAEDDGTTGLFRVQLQGGF
jgi:hypothetical protein